MKSERLNYEYNGKTYYKILPKMWESGLVLDGKPLVVGTIIETL